MAAGLAKPGPGYRSAGSDALTLEEAWELCRDLYEPLARHEPAVESFEEELVFCLLGGFGISYELNRSAAAAVTEMDPFHPGRSEPELYEAISNLLAAPRFEPRTTNGGLRRYRFPQRKATLFVQARAWLLRQPRPLSSLLAMIESERDRRTVLCECPGIGPKTASWLLRNTGLAQELAILDIHLIRALTEVRRIDATVRLPRDYELVERAFLEWCLDLDAPPAAFDLFVWEWQRGSLTSPMAA